MNHLSPRKTWTHKLVAIAASLMMLVVVVADFPAFSQTRHSMTAYLRCSRDEAIIRAFDLMAKSQGVDSLNRILNKPMRVIFKDMRSIHKSLKNYDALSWISNHGEQVIFINEKHRNAPPEALAAMIAHEALHDDEFNSLSEEVSSWGHEARIWMEMKTLNPKLAEIPEGEHPLVDRENRIEREYRQGTLTSFVRSNPGYQELPETSPGFSTVTASR